MSSLAGEREKRAAMTHWSGMLKITLPRWRTLRCGVEPVTGQRLRARGDHAFWVLISLITTLSGTYIRHRCVTMDCDVTPSWWTVPSLPYLDSWLMSRSIILFKTNLSESCVFGDNFKPVTFYLLHIHLWFSSVPLTRVRLTFPITKSILSVFS